MVQYLKIDLEEKGFKQTNQIPDSVALIIIQEALHRASEKEKDGRPRHGEFEKQVELAADNIIATFNNEKDVDNRIRVILEFNHVVWRTEAELADKNEAKPNT